MQRAHLRDELALVQVMRHQHQDDLPTKYKVQHAGTRRQVRRQLFAVKVDVDQELDRGVALQRDSQLLPAAQRRGRRGRLNLRLSALKFHHGVMKTCC